MKGFSIGVSIGKDRRVIGSVIVLALTMIFFRKAIWGSDLTLIWDVADYSYPFMAYAGHFFRLGVVPLWNSFLFNGYPSFADPQTQTFYPINLALSLISDFSPRVVYLQIIFHFFLAGLFMYALCLRFGYPMFASLIAAISYMFSGYMVGHFSHLLLDVMAWLPITVLALDAALKHRGPFWIVAGGLVIGVMILSGQSQAIFYAVFALGFHWVYRTAMEYQMTRRVRGIVSNTGVLVVMLSLGVLVAMVQLLPTAEFISQSNRSEVRSLVSAGFGIHVENLFTLVMPNYFGGISGEYWAKLDITQQNLYMGVAPLFLASLVLLYRRTAWTLYTGGIALLCLLISMGTNTPVFAFFYNIVPGFDYFRNAAHFLFVFHFYLALLAAEGATILFGEKLPGRTLMIYTVLFVVVVGVLYLMLPQPPHSIAAVSSRNATQGVIWFAGLFAVLSLVVAMSQIWRNAKFVKAFLVILVFIDVWLVSGSSVTLGERSAPDIFEQQGELAERIKRDAGFTDTDVIYHSDSLNLEKRYLSDGLFRVYVHPPERPYRVPDDQVLYNALGQNRSILHRLFVVDGYSPVVLKRHQELSQFVGGHSLIRYLELSNVRYDVTVNKRKNDVKELGKFLPRALIVGNAETIMDQHAILARLSDPSFDPYTTILLEAQQHPFDDRGPIQSRVDFLTYEPNIIEMDTVSDQNGYLLLNETYYPGWNAFVDGEESPVYRANYEFKAIALPSGSHRVRFVFRPVSFQVGLAVTLLTLVGLMLFLWFRMGRPRPDKDSSKYHREA